MNIEDDNNWFERLRRSLAWVCVVVFAASFLGLLGLSATVYWSADNSWIALLDGAWQISGAVGLLLWSLRRMANATRWLGQLFSGQA